MSLEAAKDEYLNWLVVEKGAAALTVEAYGRDLKRYLNWLVAKYQARNLDDLILDYPVNYLMELADMGYAASSQERATATLRSFHRFCLREGFIDQDLSSRLKMPKKNRNLPKVLSSEEATRLLDQGFPDSPAGTRDKALLELLYGTGIRVSELVALDRSMLLFNEGSLRVIGKGSKERLVPFAGSAQRALVEYLQKARSHLHNKSQAQPKDTAAVFLNTRGSRLTRQTVFNLVEKYGRQAGVQGLQPHTVRPSCATPLLEGGAALVSLQEILGHASIATTQIYTHLDITHLRSEYLAAHPRAAC
ncbi:MAG: tyrosine recombinase [Coriobacteriales bacterium]|jgi:integrase/recombinase XerD|nr:tyrosine recombinase [Coriobacteriales bacterium]